MSFQLACCVEMLKPNSSLLQRLALLERLPFKGIELWDLTRVDLKALRQWLQHCNRTLVNFSANRHFALTRPDHREGLLREICENMKLAQSLQCRQLMLLAEPLDSSGAARAFPTPRPADALEQMVQTLKEVVAMAERFHIRLVLEPLNTRVDHPGYFLDSAESAFEVVREVGSPHLRVLYDIYHMAAMEEPVLEQMSRNLTWIGHIHAADFPGRHEPGTGRIPYREIAEELENAGYDGWIGFEFSPLGDPVAALRGCLEAFPVQDFSPPRRQDAKERDEGKPIQK